jgi:hypothetical protein
VLPVDFAEEGCLQRIRYKLENLYPAQKEFAVCQLLNDVSSLSVHVGVMVNPALTGCLLLLSLQDGAYMNKLFKIFDSMEAKRDIEGLNM